MVDHRMMMVRTTDGSFVFIAEMGFHAIKGKDWDLIE